jgi:hypothetical protein
MTMKNNSDLNIKAVFLPGRSFAQKEFTATYDKLYSAWKTVWLDVFGQVGQADNIHPDDFFRADVIAYIEVAGEIAAMHFYTFFDLEQKFVQEHSYIKGIPDPAIEHFRKIGERNLMSLEYLTIVPKWRRSISGLPLKEAMLGLSVEYLKYTDCTSSFGTARIDVKVDELVKNFGGISIGQNLKKYDYDCVTMLLKSTQLHGHTNPEIRKFTEELWMQREDFTYKTPVSKKLKIAI